MQRSRSWSAVRRGVLLCLSLALLFSLSLIGQTVSGTIQGTVTDATGAALPGTTITIRNVDTGFQRVVVTNERGGYSAPYVPIGKYRIHAELSGMNPVEKSNIDVGLNFTRVIDFQMTVSGVTESVTVTADAPRINDDQRRGQGLADGEQIMDKPTLEPGELPRARRDVHRLPGEPDVRAEQPDRLVGLVDQLQRHRHARRDVPDQRRQQRRLVREPEPPGGRALDDQGIPGPQEQLQGGVRPRLRRGRAGADQVGDQRRPRRRYRYQQDNEWNAKSFFSPTTPKPTGTATSTASRRASRSCENKLFGFVSVDRRRRTGENNYARDLFLACRRRGPRLTRGNDTPANRAWNPVGCSPASRNADAERSAQQPDLRGAAARSNWPDEDYSAAARLEQRARAARHGALPVHAPDSARPRTSSSARTRSRTTSRQNLGLTWTQRLRLALGRGGPLRPRPPRRPTSTSRTGNDTPIIRFTGSPVSGLDHRQRRQLPDQPRPDRPPVRLQHLALSRATTPSRPASTSAARRSTTWPTTSRAASGRFNRDLRRRRPMRHPTRRSSTAACSSTRRPTARSSSRTGSTSTTSTPRTTGGSRDSLTLNLGVRYEYVGRRQGSENRIDYIYGDDDNNIEPRLGLRLGAESGRRLPGPAHGRPGQHVDPRRLRDLPRPDVPVGLLPERRQRPLQPAERALRASRNAQHAEPLRPVQRLRLHARDRRPRARSSGIRRDPTWRCRARTSGTSRSSGRCRGTRRCASATAATTGRQPDPLRPRNLSNLAQRPVTVVNHPNNAPGRRLPRPARHHHRPRRRRLALRRDRHFPAPSTRPAPCSVPIADNEISLACRARTSAGRSALHDQSR